jgi:hypothetical protein
MRKLVLILLACLAVFTYIRALENTSEPAETESVLTLTNH